MIIKKSGIVLTTFAFIFLTHSSFAISPGAGQAQVRNNMQTIQQNKQQMQQLKQNQQMYQQKKMYQPKNVQRPQQ